MRCLSALLLVVLAATVTAAAPIRGLAFVQDDATLRIGGRAIRLFGIYVPETGETCRRYERPLRCGSRAALALERKARGFIHCQPKAVQSDRVMVAVCRAGATPHSEGDDLSAYLLRHGWAVARPEAPFEYHALERIARERGLGIWGIPIDRPLLR